MLARMVDITSPNVEATPRPRAWVLFDPRGAFQSVKARPTWLASFLVVIMFALVPPIAFLSNVDEHAYIERKLRKSGRFNEVPKDRQAQVIELGAKGLKIAGPPGAVVKRALWILVVTVFAFGLLRGKKPDQKFAPILAAVTVGAAPLVIKDLLEAGAFVVLNPLEIDEQNAVLSNPAAWLGIDSQTKAVGALLRGADFFELWACALIGMGANIVASTRSVVPYFASFGLHAASTALAAVSAGFA
jgi:hypothetical protein